jgi:hypothetical protein
MATSKISSNNKTLFQATTKTWTLHAWLNKIWPTRNVMLKTEVVKLLDFYGQPDKDTISAMEFMARIDECQVTNKWNDTTTFSNF